jgi:putative endopeptidase
MKLFSVADSIRRLVAKITAASRCPTAAPQPVDDGGLIALACAEEVVTPKGLPAQGLVRKSTRRESDGLSTSKSTAASSTATYSLTVSLKKSRADRSAPSGDRNLPSDENGEPGGSWRCARVGVSRLQFSAACWVALMVILPGAQAQGEHGVDTSVSPGDDFFSYANGAWLKATEIPAGKASWGARTEIAEVTRQQLTSLLLDARASPPGSTARKVADFQAAYLNEAAIESRGLVPLKPMLDRIDQVRDKTALARLLGRGLRADADPLNAGTYNSAHLLGLAVQASIHGEKTNVAFLMQGGLGMSEREHYLGAGPRMRELRRQYEAYIARLLALAGWDRPAKRAKAVMALETAIAQSHAKPEASSNDRNADQVWIRADFASRAPGMDWAAFFAAAGLGQQQAFVAWQPSAVTGAAALVASQPLQAWKDYLRVRLIDAHADVLPRAFAETARALRGTSPSASREQRAMDATQSALSDAIGRMYAERHFAPQEQARVQAIATEVIAAFAQRVADVTWMSPAAKAMALTKLRSVYFGIGYPEAWTDYSDLVVDPADAVGNRQRVADHSYRQTVARLGQPVDRTTWAIPPHRPGATLLFHQNAYNFAAALLQPPKYDPGASDAENYGAIGAIIGHEISHFVDTLGADYEADGRMRRWWAPEDMTRYQAATAPLVAQFSSYRPFPDLAINGQLTLTENLADLGGLMAAFAAHRRALGSKVSDKNEVRRQDRQFFIGFARAWRGKSREDAIRAQVATDGHAPESYRIATVRNLDAWYEAFDVRPGQRLYLDPTARVRVW